MSRLHNTILRPLLTEKTTFQMDLHNKVTFKVNRASTKHQIRAAIEELFGVKVVSVNTQVVPGKPKRVGRQTSRTSGWKKAIVTLAEGESLDFFALEEAEEADEFGPEDFADEA